MISSAQISTSFMGAVLRPMLCYSLCIFFIAAEWGSFRNCLELMHVQPEIVQEFMLLEKTLTNGQ